MSSTEGRVFSIDDITLKPSDGICGKNLRVLSIQSHVVHGYVGNKSATFPLQVLGFDVDAINSVHFSNHTAYGNWKGQKLTAEELWTDFQGLEENDIANYTHLLTGYVGSAEFLEVVVRIAKRVREINPSIVYLCDPVLGDNGRLYVPKELIPIFRDDLLPLADIITPNQFEIETLTGIKVTEEKDAWKATEICHQKNVKTVIISSSELDSSGTLTILGSSPSAAEGSKFRIRVKKLSAHFTGTGDLFSALILAWHAAHPEHVHTALEKATATLQAVCKRTVEGLPEGAPAKDRELRIIQSKHDIENPDTTHIKAEFVVL